MEEEKVTPNTPDEESILESYWKSNLKLMGLLLFVWAFVGLGCGVLFADYLNQFMLPGTGYPLGFWFAQQGSIITFVLLILIYALLMNRLDNEHHKQREGLPSGGDEKRPFSGEGI